MNYLFLRAASGCSEWILFGSENTSQLIVVVMETFQVSKFQLASDKVEMDEIYIGIYNKVEQSVSISVPSSLESPCVLLLLLLLPIQPTLPKLHLLFTFQCLTSLWLSSLTFWLVGYYGMNKKSHRSLVRVEHKESLPLRFPHCWSV